MEEKQISFEETGGKESNGAIDALKQEVEELRRANSAKDAELEQVKTELRKAERKKSAFENMAVQLLNPCRR